MTRAYASYHLAQWLAVALPKDWSLGFAEQLADVQRCSSKTDRAAVDANLAVVLGDPAAERAQLVREVFRNFGRYLVEFLGAHRIPWSSITIEGTEPLVATLRSHAGAILLSAHVGNWELGGIVLRRLGFPTSIVVLPHRDPQVNRFFDRQRQRCGVDVIPLGLGSTQRCLERLRAGWLLAIVGDREFGSNGIVVSLFNRQVVMPRGPAILSLRTGAPAIPVFFVREGPWRFRFYHEPPIWPPTGLPAAQQVQQLTQRYAQAIERSVRRFPDQWLLFQPVFGPAVGDAIGWEPGSGAMPGTSLRQQRA